ncbi:MAG: ATP-binding protein [Acidobacteriia bacterium]|nr:ATP-binding protein [Terriglobia bacterium]
MTDPAPSMNSSFKVSPRILDHLGISAYNSVKKCLAELATNAHDADATEVRIQLPDALGESAVIEVSDNGVGMSPGDIDEHYLLIGRDRRKEDGERTPGGRLVIGSKGIGKLAGFGIASRVEVTTWKDGIQSQVAIDRRVFDDLSTLSSCNFAILSAPTERSAGTTIRLSSLNPDLSLPDANSLRRHLYKSLPQRPDFRIFVNDVECTAEDVPGERYEISEDVPLLGTVTGFYVVTNTRQQNPGLAVRVRGRMVTEPSLFGLDTRAHGFFTAEKILGEVNVDTLDPEGAQSTRIRGLINTSRDGFLEDSPNVKSLEDWAREFLKRIIQGIDTKEQKRRSESLLNRPEIRQRLNQMPPHVRGIAQRVVGAVLVKLRNVEEEEAATLIEWIVRYYESNVLRELLKAIIAADASDIQKLSELINEWGAKQVNDVVAIISDQIQIISKLEQLIASEKAKEMEVHKFVESNLWLVREGLELWSSDRPLKTLLDGNLNDLYKDKANLRPDIVCRSRDGGSEAVILEFKKPSETVQMEHVTQAMQYDGLIQKHRPGMKLETFVVGRQYDAGVLASREKLDRAGLHLWSFHDILQRARLRFEQILKILGR